MKPSKIIFLVTLVTSLFVSCTTPNCEKLLTAESSKTWLLKERKYNTDSVGRYGLMNSKFIVLRFEQSGQQFKKWFSSSREHYLKRIDSADIEGTWELKDNMVVWHTKQPSSLYMDKQWEITDLKENRLEFKVTDADGTFLFSEVYEGLE